MPSQYEINRAARVIAASVHQSVAPSRYKIGEVISPGALKMAKHRRSAARHSGASTHPVILRVLSKHDTMYTADVWGKVHEIFPDFTKAGCGNRLNVLRKAGFVSNPARGIWALTEAGKTQAESEAPPIIPGNGAARPTAADDLDRQIARAMEFLGDIKDVLVAVRAHRSRTSKNDERLAKLIKALQE